MIRRLTAAMARMGLMFALGLWVASYFVYVSRPQGNHVYTLRKGAIQMRAKTRIDTYAWRVYARPGLHPTWVPRCRSTPGLDIIVPFWVPSALCAGTWYVFRDLTRRRRRERGQCQDCGYPLQGLLEPRCPECGAVFDRERIESRESIVEPF